MKHWNYHHTALNRACAGTSDAYVGLGAVLPVIYCQAVSGDTSFLLPPKRKTKEKLKQNVIYLGTAENWSLMA